MEEDAKGHWREEQKTYLTILWKTESKIKRQKTSMLKGKTQDSLNKYKIRVAYAAY